jgi:hypothetical protein
VGTAGHKEDLAEMAGPPTDVHSPYQPGSKALSHVPVHASGRLGSQGLALDALSVNSSAFFSARSDHSSTSAAQLPAELLQAVPSNPPRRASSSGRQRQQQPQGLEAGAAQGSAPLPPLRERQQAAARVKQHLASFELCKAAKVRRRTFTSTTIPIFPQPLHLPAPSPPKPYSQYTPGGCREAQ